MKRLFFIAVTAILFSTSAHAEGGKCYSGAVYNAPECKVFLQNVKTQDFEEHIVIVDSATQCQRIAGRALNIFGFCPF